MTEIDKFRLRTDRLPNEMKTVYQNGTYAIEANKTDVRIVHTWGTNQSITMTWDEQLQLSTMLHILDGRLYALCDIVGCDCGGVALNYAIFEAEDELPVLLASTDDKSLVMSGDEEMAYIVMPDESQISICWLCVWRLKEFMNQVDTFYRGGGE